MPATPPRSPGPTIADVRAALDSARNSAAPVEVELLGASFVLSGYPLVIAGGNVTLRSSGEPATFDAHRLSSVLAVSGGANAQLLNVLLINGLAVGTGGGVAVWGSGTACTLRLCHLENCKSFDSGGAVCVWKEGSVLLFDSSVGGCNGGELGGAAAVYYSGSVTVVGTNVSRCTARSGAAFGTWMGRQPVGSNVLIIIGSLIEECSTIQGSGAGVRVWQNSHVTLVDTKISRCSAEGIGGGVHLVTDAGNGLSLSAVLIGVVVSGCSAQRGGAIGMLSGICRLANGTLLTNGSASTGSLIYAEGGVLTYLLPAPLGYWISGELCEKYTEPCPASAPICDRSLQPPSELQRW